jgi:hypothetical protein
VRPVLSVATPVAALYMTVLSSCAGGGGCAPAAAGSWMDCVVGGCAVLMSALRSFRRCVVVLVVVGLHVVVSNARLAETC